METRESVKALASNFSAESRLLGLNGVYSGLNCRGHLIVCNLGGAVASRFAPGESGPPKSTVAKSQPAANWHCSCFTWMNLKKYHPDATTLMRAVWSLAWAASCPTVVRIRVFFMSAVPIEFWRDDWVLDSAHPVHESEPNRSYGYNNRPAVSMETDNPFGSIAELNEYFMAGVLRGE